MTLLSAPTPTSPAIRACPCCSPKSRAATTPIPFRPRACRGGEIQVLGYRGMKEYEIAFDGFEVPAENLLGGVEGQGFKQLMADLRRRPAFRPPPAPSAWPNAAMELALRYAKDRIQFGKALMAIPARRRQDRHDGGGGPYRPTADLFRRARQRRRQALRPRSRQAKLLGARVAWAAADNALQIHGGNGLPWNIRSRACCATPASSAFLKARRKFRPRSSHGDCWRADDFRTERATPERYSFAALRDRSAGRVSARRGRSRAYARIEDFEDHDFLRQCDRQNISWATGGWPPARPCGRQREQKTLDDQLLSHHARSRHSCKPKPFVQPLTAQLTLHQRSLICAKTDLDFFFRKRKSRSRYSKASNAMERSGALASITSLTRSLPRHNRSIIGWWAMAQESQIQDPFVLQEAVGHVHCQQDAG